VTCNDINSILVLLVVMAGAMALASWLSPRTCRWLSLRLFARAEAVEASRAAYRQVHGEVMSVNREICE